MISLKEYQRAKQTIIQYEAQQRQLEIDRKQVLLDFPIGCLVQSKKSKHVRGEVIGYGVRECSMLLKLKYEDGEKTICLVKNAVRL